MKNNLKKGLLALSVSSLLAAGVATVSAQQGQQDNPAVEQVQRRGGPDFRQRGGGFGLDGGKRGGGLLGGRMVDGSTITATFYDGNPADGATELSSQTLNVGVDSERSFAQNIREAMQEAAFVTINTSAQSRTIELPTTDTEAETPQTGAERGFRGAPIRGLNEGSSLEAIFYDGNPEDGAAILNSLTFTAGIDSELAFNNAFQEAATDAAFITLNTSPQERTIDLSQVRERFENRKGERGFQNPNGNTAPTNLGDLG